MILVTPKNKLKPNTKLKILLNKDVVFNRIKITCSNYYSVFVNSTLKDFGPIRTSKHYARIKEIEVGINKNIEIDVLYYGFPSFDIELQDFYFGIELYFNSSLVASSLDFSYFINEQYLNESLKYSYQRGLVERYNLATCLFSPIIVKEIRNVTILEEIKEHHQFNSEKFSFLKKEEFKGFFKILDRPYLKFDSLKKLNKYDLNKNFFEVISKNKYYSYIYKLDGVKTGLFKIKISSVNKEKHKIYLVFDENYEDNKWIFGRSNCNELIEIDVSIGEFVLYSSVPYCLQYLMILIPDKSIQVNVEFIKIENENTKKESFNDKQLNDIYLASRNTFVQNSYDLFTDCPGRERAPWLCDSYFLSLAEKYFTDKNDIEKRFITNYLYQSCSTIPQDVFAMCYPSDHIDGTFIPNWGMWFILELKEYKNRSHDEDLILKFKDKVYKYYYFLKKYENELGLLENLPSWVFVEWSEANKYVSGVNFPSNILYINIIKTISELYNDKELYDVFAKKYKTINSLSYFDGFYHDHALRDKENKIYVVKDDISETCQYYALFFNMTKEKEFKEKMKYHFKEFNLKPSAVFIGKFLRYFWLLKESEKEILKEEIKINFYNMAIKTKTIWEKDEPSASMNHGFASSLAVLISECFK